MKKSEKIQLEWCYFNEYILEGRNRLEKVILVSYAFLFNALEENLIVLSKYHLKIPKELLSFCIAYIMFLSIFYYRN